MKWHKTTVMKPRRCVECQKWIDKGKNCFKTFSGMSGITYRFYACKQACVDKFEQKKRMKSEGSYA